MSTAYLALGSNLGDRWETLDGAVRRLRAEPGLRVVAVSGFYETAPVGCPRGSGDFLNAAAAIESDRTPEDLLQLFLRIERQFGRVRAESGVKGPRTLDLDLLLYGDRVINTPDLALPHPRLHERAFVLVPLAEIGPYAVHPTLGKTARQLCDAVPAGDVRPATRSPLTTPHPAETANAGEARDAGRTGPLSGLRALVTGSTGGIGKAIAEAFAAHGAEVV